MTIENRWLLPDGIEEVLPPQAECIERLRRELVDLFHAWGYELVIPPLIDFLESLLTGTGNDLDLQTFKLTDQLTGRMLGVRADMTPQVARIDAHHLKRETPVRLCYMGDVLHTRPHGFAGTRSPYQVGAELYGYGGIESDVEILQLMHQALGVAGLGRVHIDLGHVGVFRGLAKQAGLGRAEERVLFDALQRKAVPEIEALLADLKLPAQEARMLLCLVDLNGGEEILAQAAEELAGAAADVQQALENLRQIAAKLNQLMPDVTLNFDFAELRGYHYHTGVVYCAYLPGHGQGIAWGGRYDDIGSVFGRARPATGFSLDLKSLIMLNPRAPEAFEAVFAPALDDVQLRDRIAELRRDGVRIIQELPGQTGDARQMGCTHMLENRDGVWQVVALSS
jgi:ATP phosphoribosyltransferase regulatory subunit